MPKSETCIFLHILGRCFQSNNFQSEMMLPHAMQRSNTKETCRGWPVQTQTMKLSNTRNSETSHCSHLVYGSHILLLPCPTMLVVTCTCMWLKLRVGMCWNTLNLMMVWTTCRMHAYIWVCMCTHRDTDTHTHKQAGVVRIMQVWLISIIGAVHKSIQNNCGMIPAQQDT